MLLKITGEMMAYPIALMDYLRNCGHASLVIGRSSS
jgi:hypothetical protein